MLSVASYLLFIVMVGALTSWEYTVNNIEMVYCYKLVCIVLTAQLAKPYFTFKL